MGCRFQEGESNFTSEETFNDDIRLSDALDELLSQSQSARGNVVFVNVDRFPNSYSLKGRYQKSSGGYKATCRIFRGDTAIETFEVVGANVAELSAAVKGKLSGMDL